MPIRIDHSSPEYKLLTRSVYERDGWRCVVCLRREQLTPHHVKYLSRGGDDADYNMVTLCMGCHDAEHRHDLELVPVVFNADTCRTTYKVIFKNGWTPYSFSRRSQ